MSEDMNNIPENEEVDNIIVLNDAEGNEVQFALLDLIDFEGEAYVLLLPAEETEDAGEVVILQVEDTDSDEESYISVEDEDVLNKVFEIFKDKFKDEFNFVD